MWCIVKYGRRYILSIQVVSFMLHSLRTPNKDFVVIHLDERHTNKMHSLTVVTVIYHTCVERDSCAGSFYFFIFLFFQCCMLPFQFIAVRCTICFSVQISLNFNLNKNTHTKLKRKPQFQNENLNLKITKW